MKIRTKRVYDAAEDEDGFRVLLDWLWQRVLSKARADLDLWDKDVAPSTEKFAAARVIHVTPGTGSEDLGILGAAAGVPSVYWFLGGAVPQLFAPPADLMQVVAALPSNHSPQYAPVIEALLDYGAQHPDVFEDG